MEGNSGSQDTTKKVNEKLINFVTYFVKEFETKLLYYYLILNREIVEAEKNTQLLAQLIGGTLGAGLGLLVTAPVAGANLGKKLAEKVANKLGNDVQIREGVKLSDLINSHKDEEDQFRLKLIEAGCDVFQSFEMQFMRVTRDQDHSITIRQLAKDATNRAIRYLKQQKDTSISESVILGEPKKVFLSIGNSGIKLPKTWNIASLYNKVGIVRETTNSPSYYKKKNDTSRTDKYGYRRLLANEIWDNIKEDYVPDNVIEQFSNYKYAITRENLKEQSKKILDNVNKDKKFDQDRMKEILNEVKKEILDSINSLMNQTNENFETLQKLAHNIENLKIDDYMKLFNELVQLRQGQGEIKSSIDELETELRKQGDCVREIKDKLGRLSQKPQTEGTLSGLGIMKYYYIPRKLNRHIEIKKDLLEDTSNFLITYNSEIERSSLIRDIISISNEPDNFEKLCDEYKDYNIHWLKYEESKLIWKQSKGSLTKLRKFVNKEVQIYEVDKKEVQIYEVDKKEVQIYEEDKVSNIEDIVVVISAEPGMGKSTLLTHLAIKQKSESTSFNVIQINLNDHTTKISATNFDNTNNILEFLKEISNIKDLKELKHSILLIDGFDEIASNSDYKYKVLHLVKFLKNEKTRLWITTRPNAQYDLEEQLNIFSYTIKPLSKDAQKKFLEKFWKTNFIYDVIKKLTFKISSELEDTKIKNLAEQISKIIKLEIVEFNDDNDDAGGLKQILNFISAFDISKTAELVKQITNLINKQLGEQHIVSKNIKNFVEKVVSVATSLDNIKDLIQERAQSYADKLITKFSESVSNNETEFTGVPLQVRMLAEAFQEEVYEDFIESYNLQLNQGDLIQPKLPQSLNLLDLYKRFIENKYRINFVEKGNIDLANVFNIRLYNNYREIFIKEHQLLGLALLFSQKDLEKLLSKQKQDKIDELNKSIGDGTENTGIVYQINGKPQFIHRTFAEYFAADFFVAKRMKLSEFLREYIFKAENKVIQHFFDRILTDDKAGENLYAIHRAVLNNDKDQIITLLSHSQNTKNIIASVDKAGRTALYLAATDGYLEIVEILLEHVRTIGIEDTIFGLGTPLDVALCRGQLEVAYCLGKKFNLRRNDVNNLQLIVAATNGNSDVIVWLLERERVDKDFEILGWTPLHQAMIYYNEKIIQILVKKCAKCDRRPNPKHHWNEPFEKLVRKNAKIDYVNQDGYTPLHCAAKGNKPHVIEWFEGVNLNVTDKKGTTPLHIAAFHGNFDFVKFLVSNNANINATDNCGATVVFSAACNNNFDVVNFLLDKKAKIDSDGGIIGKLGLTVLHFAALYGELETVEHLIKKKKANVNAGLSMFTPLHFAALSNRTDTIKYLIDNHAEVNALVNFDQCVQVFEEEQQDFINTSMYTFIKKLIRTCKNLHDFEGLTPFGLYNMFKYENEQSLELLKPLPSERSHKSKVLIRTSKNDLDFENFIPFGYASMFKNKQSPELLKPLPSERSHELRNYLQELFTIFIEFTNEKTKTHKCNSLLENLRSRVN